MADAHHKKTRRQVNDNISLAWHTAALMRVEKMPELKSLLVPEEEKHQTDEEMLEIAKLLNAAYGGEVVLQ